jgi:putative nucleotidyltransferase with HDIG domain
MTPEPGGRTIPAGTQAPRDRELGGPPRGLDELQIHRIVSVTGDLPPVPHVAARVMELVERDDTSVRELQQAVASDQALAATILRTANSVFYSFDQKISTLSHAIVILGFRAVQSMAVAAASRSLFAKRGGRFGPRERLLWEHSFGCAMACRQIARIVGFEKEETAFLAGLLHDVGRAVLNQVVPHVYARVFEIAERERRPFVDVEREQLGFDHGHVGALVAQKWSFPRDLVDAIARHHAPEARTAPGRLSAILAAADEIVSRLAAGSGAPERAPLAEHWGVLDLGLDERACDRVREMVQDVLDDERKLYGP